MRQSQQQHASPTPAFRLGYEFDVTPLMCPWGTVTLLCRFQVLERKKQGICRKNAPSPISKQVCILILRMFLAPASYVYELAPDEPALSYWHERCSPMEATVVFFVGHSQPHRGHCPLNAALHLITGGWRWWCRVCTPQLWRMHIPSSPLPAEK
jgi:hypothetical protein